MHWVNICCIGAYCSVKEPDRAIYLAVPVTAYLGIFRSPVGEVAITDFALRLLVFEAEQEVIVQWIE